MIVRSLCNSCFQTYELRLLPGDDRLLNQIAEVGGRICACPRACGGKINLVNDVSFDRMREGTSLREPIILSAQELYMSVLGLPLPDELPKDRELLVMFLKDAIIKDCVVEELGGRFYLHELVLTNGKVIHLAAGARGAQVLKITKEVSGAVGPAAR